MAYLTLDQVAQKLNISRVSVYRLVNTDASFPVTRIGKGAQRVNEVLLEKWEESKTQASRQQRSRVKESRKGAA